MGFLESTCVWGVCACVRTCRATIWSAGFATMRCLMLEGMGRVQRKRARPTPDIHTGARTSHLGNRAGQDPRGGILFGNPSPLPAARGHRARPAAHGGATDRGGVVSPRAEGGTGARRPDPPGPVPARPRPASPGGMLRPGSPKPRLRNEAGQDLKGEP